MYYIEKFKGFKISSITDAKVHEIPKKKLKANRLATLLKDLVHICFNDSIMGSFLALAAKLGVFFGLFLKKRRLKTSGGVIQ